MSIPANRFILSSLFRRPRSRSSYSCLFVRNPPGPWIPCESTNTGRGRLSGNTRHYPQPLRRRPSPGTADKLSVFLTVTLTQALEHQQSIHCLAVYADPLDETQHCPEPPVTECRMRFDQPLNAFRQDSVEPRRCRSNYRARPQPGPGKFQNSTRSAHRYAGQRRHHSSDVPGVVGRLAASRRMSRSMVSSPTLRLSRLTSSSRNASSSFCRARSAFSAPSRKRSRHPSTSATFSPCRRAASTAVVSPLSKLIIKAARRLAVQHWTSSGRSSSAICHLAGPSTLYYWWLDLKGEHDTRSVKKTGTRSLAVFLSVAPMS